MCNLAVTAILAGLLASPSPTLTQDSVTSVPSDSKFFVHINIDAFRRTHLGGRLFEMAKREAMKEIAENDDEGKFKEMKETLGIDPFTDLDAITVVGTDFDDPEDSVYVIFSLKKNAGNLEDLVTTLPGYSSSDYGKHVIHSATVDDGKDERAFACVHSDRRGVKRVVAAAQLSRVKSLLDMLDGKQQSRARAIELSQDEAQFGHIELLDIPRKAREKGPQASVAKMIKGLTINVGDDNDDLVLSLTLKTEEERDAKRIRQMLQGFIALAQLAQDSSDGPDADAEKLAELLENLEIKRKKNVVRVRLVVPEGDLVELIEDEMEVEI